MSAPPSPLGGPARSAEGHTMIAPRVVGGPLPLEVHAVDALGWSALAQQLHDRGARLLSLWGEPAGDGDRIWACWLDGAQLVLAALELAADTQHYPGLHALFPAAERMQRALRDLLGPQATGGDPRPWLRHAAWGADWHPLSDATPPTPGDATPYPFVAVDGEGVHEIAVGPVHAGVIEPGQFRFSVVGEKVLRLEQRLGFTHKGVARRFTELDLDGGLKLAARLCGDSTVAYAWAYCVAREALADVTPPPRALALRALLLERERIANHLGDLGAIANDAGFAFALAQFSRLKEDLLRLNAQLFGARYLMDALCPGGVAVDVDAAAVARLHEQDRTLRDEALRLRAIVDEHEGLHDRLRTTGRVEPALARRLGMIGLAGRASGQDLDLRALAGWAPFDALGVRAAVRDGGDVAARFEVRYDELFASLTLCDELLATLPAGALFEPLAAVAEPALGLGLVEGWRGPVLVALHAAGGDRIARCHVHDPSWQNWPALEWAVIHDIVPDFPLINKSFNLAYSGHDG